MEKSRAETAERIRTERRKESAILAMAELCKRECGAEVETTWRCEQSYTFSGNVADVRKAGRWLESLGMNVEYSDPFPEDVEWSCVYFDIPENLNSWKGTER